MLRPAMSQILRDGESYYAFVVAIAKRAREIADEQFEKGQSVDEKSVNIALQEFASGKIRIRDVVKIKDAE